MARTGTPPPRNRPTPERVARAVTIEPPDMDGVAFRAWWTLTTRLDRLHPDGLISQAAAYAAACQFRCNCEHVAVVPGSTLDRFDERVAGKAGDRHAQVLSRLGAARRLRLIRARLDLARYWLAFQCVVEDAAWSATARQQLGVSGRTVRMATAAASEELAELR